VFQTHARSKFCRYGTNFVFRQRGVLHPAINQYDMVILIRLAGKVAIAASAGPDRKPDTADDDWGGQLNPAMRQQK